ncbi:MAG: sugar transferase [Planctomycetes bacterium]|jgi:lipopolysaccharide/colanic/teichoic acid biosynthesis glycosyltransferase|nr:sugar transferase [Phycisphaerae bacterium]NBB96329.1 sugar transferase [Planctomycetota bacterium]
MIRRAIDIFGSLAALGLVGPLMVALAVWLRLDSPGPAVFRQRRAGWHGRPFTLLKFRTMCVDTDPYGISPHGGEDPRLTTAGRWLRERSLDELPQLINVLRGEMTLVGPRPLYERQAALWNDRQRRRLEVKPGLTGYAQICGRGRLTHEDKIELDVQYVERRSPWLDVRILARTLTATLQRGDDVYEQQYSHERLYETDTSEAGDAR